MKIGPIDESSIFMEKMPAGRSDKIKKHYFGNSNKIINFGKISQLLQKLFCKRLMRNLLLV